MTTRVTAARVLCPADIGAAAVTVDKGRITAVEPLAGPAEHEILAPGFVDLQVNGAGGYDVGSPDAQWEAVDDALARQGVTSWCPTLTSRPIDRYPEAIGGIAVAAGRSRPRPDIVGVHLEGPFLAPEFARAHPVEHLAPVDLEWLSALPQIVRLVTLAPELPGAPEAIRALVERGVVVALGHSGASADEVRGAADAGATLVTHLFNAMATFHHRDPGLVGVALTDPRLTVSLIADLVHMAPDALRLAIAAAGVERTVLVTDAAAAEGDRFGRDLELRDGAPRLPDGTIAGSALTMDRAVANLVRHVGVPLEVAVAAASTNPARVLGLTDRGRIEPGARADLVALDDDFTVETVWVGGERLSG